MNKIELRTKIKNLIKQKYTPQDIQIPREPEYEEVKKFPDLKVILTDLLSDEYNSFISSIDWVAPKPTTFRINLRNNHFFYLLVGEKSWIAEIEGKPYYLINISEKESASKSLANILRYIASEKETESDESTESYDGDEESSKEPEIEDEFSL